MQVFFKRKPVSDESIPPVLDTTEVKLLLLLFFPEYRFAHILPRSGRSTIQTKSLVAMKTILSGRWHTIYISCGGVLLTCMLQNGLLSAGVSQDRLPCPFALNDSSCRSSLLVKLPVIQI